jgi:glycosyltransferase involved in cell wall biosynthesis
MDESLVVDKNCSNTAVLIPCLNEENTISEVVDGFRRSLPGATVYVYDNMSNDGTVEKALQAGAVVRKEDFPGKGQVVRRMFADVDADIYVLIDGDGTYDTDDAPLMIKKLTENNLDMVVGSRDHLDGRLGHGIGNRLFNHLYRWLFGNGFTDIFSGYRVFTRRFVASFPAVSTGFEIETEISVHASQLQLPVSEMKVSYSSRPDGSFSKLRTFVDGWRILKAMGSLLKNNRPLTLFGSLSFILTATGLAFGIPIIVDFAQTGIVEKLPTAVLVAVLTLGGLLMLALGFILDMSARSRLEIKRLFYLQSR